MSVASGPNPNAKLLKLVKAAKNKKEGAPDWIVTFADLMSLLVCFFVLIISFSVQDQQRLQIVAGSMREAFGIEPLQRKSGIIELDANPTRTNFRHMSADNYEISATQVGPYSGKTEDGVADPARDMHFSSAAATLRQALQDLPDIAEISRHILIEETPEGLAIQLMDQEGRSMFDQDQSRPLPHLVRAIAAITPSVRDMPHRIQISGHTAAVTRAPDPDRGPWELSTERANAVRNLFETYGLPTHRVHSIIGHADTQPLFLDDPFLPGNRRVTILLMREAPPIPPGIMP